MQGMPPWPHTKMNKRNSYIDISSETAFLHVPINLESRGASKPLKGIERECEYEAVGHTSLLPR